MAKRIHLLVVLAVLSLCGAARPAFADGVFPSEGALLSGLIGLLVLVAMGILVVVLVIKWLARATSAGSRARQARAAGSELPEARVLEPDRQERKPYLGGP